MRTAHRTLGRRHAVQEDERSTLSGRGKRDRRVVLVGACGVAGLGGEFDTHPASLHEPFTRPARSRKGAPGLLVRAGHAPEFDRNDQLRHGCGGASCQSRWETSNRHAGGAPHRPRRDLPANSPPMFTPSGGRPGDARPPLTGTGRVRSRTGGSARVDRSSPGPKGRRKRECEHRCRRCGLGAKASRRPLTGPRRARPLRPSVRRRVRPRTSPRARLHLLERLPPRTRERA